MGCADDIFDDDRTDNVLGVFEESSLLSTDQDVMLFSTLSSASILGSESSIQSVSDAGYLFESDKPKIEVDMEKANSYLLMMENMLADGGPIVMSEEASDRDEYDKMMVVSVKDLAGNVSQYTIYYSIIEEVTSYTDSDLDGRTEPTYPDYDEETVSGNGNHKNKAEDYFKNHHYGRDYDDEIKYQINALAIIEGVEYRVIGNKEVEIDDNEVETETSFRIILDDYNYVRIEQEIEDDETEYKYTIYKNGHKQSSLKFETDIEYGVNVVKLTSEENGNRETYKFIKEADKTIIKYDGNGYSYTLIVTSKIDEVTGEIVYEYKAKEKEYNWEYRKEHHNKKD